MHAILNLALIVALISPASAAYASNLQPAAANAAQSDYYEQPSSGNAPSFVAQTPPPPKVASDSGSAYPMKPPSAGAVNNVRPRPPPPPPAVRNSEFAAYRPPPPAQMVAVRPRPLAAETMQEVPCDHTMTVVPQAASTSIKVMYKTVTLASRPTTVTLEARPTTVTRTVTRDVMPTAQAAQPTYTSVLNVAAVRPTAAAGYEQKVAPSKVMHSPPPPANAATAADKDCEESTGGALAENEDVPVDQMPEDDVPEQDMPEDESPYYPKYPWDGPEPEWPRDNVPDESDELPIDDEEDWPIDDEEDWPIDEEEDWPVEDGEDQPIEDGEDLPIEDGEDLPIEEQDPTDPTDPMEPIDDEPFPPFEDLPAESLDAQDDSEEIGPHHLVRRAVTKKPKACKVNTFQCSGRTSFQKCDHGKWFNFKCAPGTVCVKKARGSILCDWPKST